jgi:signal transduction histidine kinase
MIDERLYLKRLKNCQLIEDIGCEMVDLQMEMVSIDQERGAVQGELRLKEVQLNEFQMKLPETPESQFITEIKEILLEINDMDRRISELKSNGLEKERQFVALKNQIQREIKQGINEILNESIAERDKILKKLSISQKQALKSQREWKDTKNQEAHYKWITHSEAVLELENQLEKLEDDIKSIKRVMKMEFGE